ncbi:hypothetical protein PTE30175_04968 [Pandoraea terrae]|uniref:Uncharacterized protein n=1 Tax=Pandoraea terrae TaxID=1537710 RepID=A0A5E4Z4P8_9BURK|nr:hypothetical protein PTE30175_04968 [Pandoraea terrae]
MQQSCIIARISCAGVNGPGLVTKRTRSREARARAIGGKRSLRGNSGFSSGDRTCTFLRTGVTWASRVALAHCSLHTTYAEFASFDGGRPACRAGEATSSDRRLIRTFDRSADFPRHGACASIPNVPHRRQPDWLAPSLRSAGKIHLIAPTSSFASTSLRLPLFFWKVSSQGEKNHAIPIRRKLYVMGCNPNLF